MLSRAVMGAFLGALAFSGAALADDFDDWCHSSMPQGADVSKIEETCACLAKATEGKTEARNSMEAADQIKDRETRFAALNAEAQAAVSSCR